MARKHSNTPATQAAPATPVQPTTPASPVLAALASTVQAAPMVPTPASVRALALATLAASANPPAWLATPIVATLPPSLIARGQGYLPPPRAYLQTLPMGTMLPMACCTNVHGHTTCNGPPPAPSCAVPPVGLP